MTQPSYEQKLKKIKEQMRLLEAERQYLVALTVFDFLVELMKNEYAKNSNVYEATLSQAYFGENMQALVLANKEEPQIVSKQSMLLVAGVSSRELGILLHGNSLKQITAKPGDTIESLAQKHLNVELSTFIAKEILEDNIESKITPITKKIKSKI